MAKAPNIGDVGASVERGGATGTRKRVVRDPKRWTTSKYGIRVPEGVSRQPSYNLDFSMPFAKFNQKYLKPNYTPSELLALGSKGYVGSFIKGDKSVFNVLGPAYSTQKALLDLRAGRPIAPFVDATPTNRYGMRGSNVAGGVLDAASEPTGPEILAYREKAAKFTSKYGEDGAKYVKQWGKLPGPDSKYGDLFGANTQAITDAAINKFRDDNYSAVLGAYQNNLATQVGGISKGLQSFADSVRDTNPTLAAAFDTQALNAFTMSKTHLTSNSKDGQYSKVNLRELEKFTNTSGTDSFPSTTQDATIADKWDKQIKDIIATSAGSETLNVSSGALLALSTVSPAAAGFLATDLGKRALEATNRLSAPGGLLASSKPDSSNIVDLTSTGLINSVKSLGRIVNGLPMAGLIVAESVATGVGSAADGNFTGPNTFGGMSESVASSLKAEYVRRYKTPFDEGITNPNSWKKFGNIILDDPIAPALDLLSIVPVVGWIAKGAGLASVAANTAKAGSVIGYTAEGTAKLVAAESIVAGANASGKFISSAGEILNREMALTLNKRLQTTQEANAARKLLDEDTVIQKAYDHIFDVDTIAGSGSKTKIGSRTLAGVLSKAKAGDRDALRLLATFRDLGLSVPEGGFFITAASKFESRVDKLRVPVNRIDQAQNTAELEAVRRFAGSPVARAVQKGTLVFTRSLQTGAKGATDAASGTRAVRPMEIIMRLPNSLYDWQYGRALGSKLQTSQGDLATTAEMGHNAIKVAEQANLDAPMSAAVLSLLGDSGMGHSGLKWMDSPAYQRTIGLKQKTEIQAKIDAGEGAPIDHADIKAIDARLSLLPEQAAYEKSVSELLNKINNPDTPAAPHVEAAFEVYNRQKQYHARVQRIVHGDSLPTSVGYFKMVYAEVMQAINLMPKAVFGAAEGWGKGGELYKWRNKVVQGDANFPLHEAMNNTHDAHNLFLDKDSANVFDKIPDATEKKQRIQDSKVFLDDLRRNGVLRDGTGAGSAQGNPPLVLAEGAKLTDDFVRVHMPQVDGNIDALGVASRRGLVDESVTYSVPREFFASEGLSKLEARNALEHGVLNAMHDNFPTPQFYSDKVSESGARGVAATFKDFKTESIVATEGLKAHTQRMRIESATRYLKNRYERTLLPLLEANAVLVPMADWLKGSHKGGYLLKGTNVFDDPLAAEQFAIARKIHTPVRAGIDKELSAPGSTMAKTPFTIEGGFGYIERDGKKAYVVKSGLTDYGTLAVREQMMQLENKFDYRDALYDLSTHPSIEASYALVVPKHVDKMVQRIVNEGHDAVSNFLKNNNAAQATNIWKRMALFSAQFIGSNVIGGTAIAMIHNPLMGHKIMLSGLERGALKAGIKDYSTIVADDAALTYHLAYELRHNIFSEEAGIRNLTDARHAGKLKKYGWNGGYTVVAAFEHMLRTLVAKDFLQRDPVFKAFMGGPETRRYVENGIDFAGSRRKNISNFEAAADLTLDPTSEFFQADLKTRMRYVTDTVSGNYHSFAPSEQFVRNFLSPFYAWQRHSLAFTTRLPIDSPIKANIGSQFGQYGYQQQLADGNLPSFMYQTIPLPEFISSTLGLDKNTRVDMSNITPFGATADMAGALVQALTTQRVGRNVFSFSHPGINALIKSVLNVDPQTGIPIRPGEENGLLHNIAQTFENTPMFKVPKTLTWDLIQGAYSQDAMTRKFAQVDNPADILSGYDSTADPSKPWSLKVPRELMIAQSGSYKEQALKTLSPIRFYAVNVDRMSLIAKKEAVAIAALHGMRNDANKSRVEEYVARVRKWKALNDVVQHVWLPKAISSGFDPKQIAIVLAKVESDKPTKGSFGVSFDDVLKAIGG